MQNFQEEAAVFRAFCDENRLRILELLRGGETCACVLLERLTIAQSTLSHHMKILAESGVVTARKSGKWMYYTISEAGLVLAARVLARLSEPAEPKESGCGCAP